MTEQQKLLAIAAFLDGLAAALSGEVIALHTAGDDSSALGVTVRQEELARRSRELRELAARI